jgi:hypothetical protein
MLDQIAHAIADADGAAFDADPARYRKLALAAIKPLIRPTEAMIDAEAVRFDEAWAINTGRFQESHASDGSGGGEDGKRLIARPSLLFGGHRIMYLHPFEWESPVMDINEAIVGGGTDAVVRYGKVAGLHQDNEIPEIFLGGFIASRIYDGLDMYAHVERPYTVMADELGHRVTRELLTSMGGLRADVAIYDRSMPIAIMELKVFDEGTSVAAILADRDKMLKLTKVCAINAYLGVLVTDVRNAACADRLRLLSAYSGGSRPGIPI